MNAVALPTIFRLVETVDEKSFTNVADVQKLKVRRHILLLDSIPTSIFGTLYLLVVFFFFYLFLQERLSRRSQINVRPHTPETSEERKDRLAEQHQVRPIIIFKIPLTSAL